MQCAPLLSRKIEHLLTTQYTLINLVWFVHIGITNCPAGERIIDDSDQLYEQ